MLSAPASAYLRTPFCCLATICKAPNRPFSPPENLSKIFLCPQTQETQGVEGAGEDFYQISHLQDMQTSAIMAIAADKAHKILLSI